MAGFWQRLLGIDSTDAAQRVLPEPYEPFYSTGGIPVMDPGSPLELMIGEKTRVESFWKSQPNLRKVVDFIARNVASIPVNAYLRVSDNDRQRLRDGDLAGVLRAPRRGVGPYRFWHSTLSDALLYDRWLILPSLLDNGSTELVQVPSWRIRFEVDALRRVKAIRYWVGDEPGEDQWRDVPLEEAIFDHGYAPRAAGLSPVETLRDVLDESAEAVKYRRQVWENGARVPGFISRPSGVEWKEEQRSRFVEQMRATYGRDGSKAGGLPLLEDGMRLESTSAFKPQETQDLEGRQLSAIEVAAAFHIAPELVGARQGNYSNVREFRQMLYRDSLGPYIKSLEDALNAQLVPLMGDGREVYVEANVDSKLRGSFEEQAQIMQSATGAPWLTRNEARAMQNRAPVAGGDDLVVPLNVLTGGQASPRDSGTQNRNAAPVPRLKAQAESGERDALAEVLRKFFARQERVVRGAMGAKAADWWDADRWDSELADDLYRYAVEVSQGVAEKTLDAIGFGPDAYDADRTLAWLREVSQRSAGAINETTLQRIQGSAGADEVDQVFAAQEARADQIATANLTLISSFATVEAGRQVGGDNVRKTWVTGSNPRPEHARMNGQTVGIDEKFSNGALWPGDGANLGADNLAGCNCGLAITVEGQS